MHKERNVTNQILSFNEDVKASELKDLVDGFTGDVVIAKKLIIDKELKLSCNLYVLDKIKRKNPITAYPITINGNLYCYDEVHCNDINVDGNFFCESFIYAKDISVEGDFTCYSKIDAYGSIIRVAGDFECYGAIAKKVVVFNSIKSYGPISAPFIRSGY